MFVSRLERHLGAVAGNSVGTALVAQDQCCRSWDHGCHTLLVMPLSASTATSVLGLLAADL